MIAGLVYNFLPFMTLPLYASLDKVDYRLIEAAGDLYSSPFTGFRKVTFPLALPGVVAGTLLTFIPACGDYINAELLGTPKQYMVGNRIQSAFLTEHNYPLAASLSIILMVVVRADGRALRPPGRHRGPGLMATTTLRRPARAAARRPFGRWLGDHLVLIIGVLGARLHVRADRLHHRAVVQRAVRVDRRRRSSSRSRGATGRASASPRGSASRCA